MDKNFTFYQDEESIHVDYTSKKLTGKIKAKGHQILSPAEVAEAAVNDAMSPLRHLAPSLTMLGRGALAVTVDRISGVLDVIACSLKAEFAETSERDILGLVFDCLWGEEGEDGSEDDSEGDEEGRVSLNFRREETGEDFSVNFWFDPENGYSWQIRCKRGEHGMVAGGDGYGDFSEANAAAAYYVTEQRLLEDDPLPTFGGSLSGGGAVAWGRGLLN